MRSILVHDAHLDILCKIQYLSLDRRFCVHNTVRRLIEVAAFHFCQFIYIYIVYFVYYNYTNTFVP